MPNQIIECRNKTLVRGCFDSTQGIKEGKRLNSEENVIIGKSIDFYWLITGFFKMYAIMDK